MGPWTQTIDRFYLLPSGLQARTSTSVAKPGPDAPTGTLPKYHVSHVIKTPIAQVVLHTGTSFDARVSVKQEEPVFEEELPDRVDELNLVRFKQRRSFQYVDAPGWVVDVTLVWQKPTYTQAETALHYGETPIYEIELECVSPAAMITASSPEVITLHLLLKTLDLLLFDHPALLPAAP
jgi:hypothetical protein